MAELPKITIQLGAFQNIFNKAVAGHVADLRHALRGIEDGSFVEKAGTVTPGAVIGLQFSETVTDDGASHRHTRRCFRSVIADFLTFIDQMLAARRIIERGLKVPPGGLNGPEAVLAFVQSALDAEYHTVASDTSLRNRGKIGLLVKAGALSKDSANVIGSYIEVRRVMEHHRGIPADPTVIFFRRMKAFFCEREILSLPAVGREGESVIVRMETEKKLLPSGEKIAITEAEIDSVVFGLQIIAAEIVEGESKRKAAAVAGTAGTTNDGAQGPANS